MLNIQVVYAKSSEIQQQAVVDLQIKYGLKVQEVIHLSGVLNLFPEINLDQYKVGIFGELQDLSTVVKDGDRVEIYTPLLHDPNTARKLQLGRNK